VVIVENKREYVATKSMNLRHGKSVYAMRFQQLTRQYQSMDEKTHDLRDRTMRLYRRGTELMRGGSSICCGTPAGILAYGAVVSHRTHRTVMLLRCRRMPPEGMLEQRWR
jgi:hypothetical protein